MVPMDVEAPDVVMRPGEIVLMVETGFLDGKGASLLPRLGLFFFFLAAEMPSCCAADTRAWIGASWRPRSDARDISAAN